MVQKSPVAAATMCPGLLQRNLLSWDWRWQKKTAAFPAVVRLNPYAYTSKYNIPVVHSACAGGKKAINVSPWRADSQATWQTAREKNRQASEQAAKLSGRTKHASGASRVKVTQRNRQSSREMNLSRFTHECGQNSHQPSKQTRQTRLA